MASVRPIQCGVDYLTTTWPAQIRETPLLNTRTVIEWAEQQKGKRGLVSVTKPWAWQGYAGWSCGQLAVGERLDGAILRLSGVMADKWLGDGLPTGHNVSRLDIALTIFDYLPQSEVIALHSEEAERYRKTLQCRPFRVRYIDGKGDGDTLYIGSRSSELFARIYDKEKEQTKDESFKGALRYECECKEQLAFDALALCIAGGYSRASCLAVLVGLLLRRGIYPLGVGDTAAVVIPPTTLPVSSVESSLSWLEEQVSPTIRRLIREGYELEVLEALSLSYLLPEAKRYDD